MEDGGVVDVRTPHPGLHVAVGRLQEAAVQAEDLVPTVAGQPLERLRAVHDGHVGFRGVAEEEGARGVDGPEVDAGVRTQCHGDLSRVHVSLRGTTVQLDSSREQIGELDRAAEDALTRMLIISKPLGAYSPG